MPGESVGARREASPQTASDPPHKRSKARLPDHFAAAFAFQDDSSASSSRMPPQDREEAASSSNELSPRKSPRAKQTRIPNLSAAFADDDDEYRPRSTSASPAKRRGNKASESYTSEDDVQSSPRKAGESPSRKRIRRTRDDPNSAAGSIYAHLKAVPDLFAERNDIMLCGINPGVKSSSAGHHFAHRSNHFYPSLHLAGITEHRMKPEQDVEFPFLRPFSLGLTNLAGRPTAEGSELLPSELVDGVPVLLEKVRKWKPRTVCFVGKGISEAFMKGLKQAGAIQSGSSKRGRSSQAASPRKAASSSRIKLEDSDIGSDSASIKMDEDEKAAPRSLQACVPTEILSAYAADAVASQSHKPRKDASPEKPKKQLYTKGNSKDDSGYGLLPICVPHSKSSSDGLTVDDVTLFFVTPSSSARVTTHFLDDKARILKNLRRLVQHLQDGSAGTQTNGDTHIDVKIEEEIPPADGLYVEVPPYRDTKMIDLEVVDVSRFLLSASDSAAVY